MSDKHVTAPVVFDLWGKLAEACDDVRGQRRGEDFLAYGHRVRERLGPIIDEYIRHHLSFADHVGRLSGGTPQ